MSGLELDLILLSRGPTTAENIMYLKWSKIVTGSDTLQDNISLLEAVTTQLTYFCPIINLRYISTVLLPC